MLYSKVQYSTVQCSTVQLNTMMQYKAIAPFLSSSFSYNDLSLNIANFTIRLNLRTHLSSSNSFCVSGTLFVSSIG